MEKHELGGDFDSAKGDEAGIEEVIYRLDEAVPRPSLSELRARVEARLREQYEREQPIEEEL